MFFPIIEKKVCKGTKETQENRVRITRVVCLEDDAEWSALVAICSNGIHLSVLVHLEVSRCGAILPQAEHFHSY